MKILITDPEELNIYIQYVHNTITKPFGIVKAAGLVISGPIRIEGGIMKLNYTLPSFMGFESTPVDLPIMTYNNEIRMSYGTSTYVLKQIEIEDIPSMEGGKKTKTVSKKKPSTKDAKSSTATKTKK